MSSPVAGELHNFLNTHLQNAGQSRTCAVPTISPVRRSRVGTLTLCPPYRLQTARPSLRRNVLAVLHGQDDARAVVEAVAILFGEVVDALACRDFLLREQ